MAEASTPSTDAEKRLEGLLWALKAYCLEGRVHGDAAQRILMEDILKIIGRYS